MSEILATTNSSAADMTSALKVYGCGDMGNGIRKFANNCHDIGFVHGVVFTSVIFISGASVKKAIEYYKKKHIENELKKIKESA